MMIVPDSGSYAKSLVNELFVQVVCGNAPITIFANALRIRNLYNIQTPFSRIERGTLLPHRKRPAPVLYAKVQ